MEVLGHCMRCKEKRQMQNVELVTMKNGRKAAKGQCIECTCGMYKILSKEDREKLEKES